MKAGAPLFCYRLSVFSEEGKLHPGFVSCLAARAGHLRFVACEERSFTTGLECSIVAMLLGIEILLGISGQPFAEATPTPRVFSQRVRNYMKTNGSTFSEVQKSAKECARE